MDSLILDYGGALDYGVPAGTYYSDPAGEIAALTAKLETAESEARRQMQHVAATLQKLEEAEKENARIQDALIPKPLQPASVPHAYMLEEAARHANYWVEGARNAPDRTAAFICLHSSVNGWKNAAYAMAEKRMAAEAKITEQAAQIEALEKDAARYREQEWQPIEIAPKDGRHLAVMKNGVISVIVWLDGDHPCADAEGWYEHWNLDSVEPTHWMPLPAVDTAILGDSHV